MIIAIIPTTNLNNSKEFNKWKKKLLDNGYYVRRIINCGPCFHKIGVVASIVVIDNYEDKTSYKLFDCVMNKKTDMKRVPHVGHVVKPSGQAKIDAVKADEGFDLIEEYDDNSSWSESSEQKRQQIVMKVNKDHDSEFKDSVFQQLEAYFSTGCGLNTRRFGKLFEALDTMKAHDAKYNSDSIIKIVFGKLFEQVRFKPRAINKCTETTKETGYPLISASYKNNGACCYINEFDFDGQYLSVAKDGSNGAGTAFYQHGRFSMAGATCLFQLKPEFQSTPENDELIYLAFAEYLTEQKHYDYQNKPSADKILSTLVEIPNKDPVLTLIPESLFEQEQMIKIRVGDIFESAGRGSHHSYNDLNDGEYPFIALSSDHNGVVKYVDFYDFDGEYVSVSTFGHCFVQRGKFAIKDELCLLRLKNEYEQLKQELVHISELMTDFFVKRHSFSQALRLNTCLSSILSIPSTDLIFQICPQLIDLDTDYTPNDENQSSSSTANDTASTTADTSSDDA